jgi:hypothetical protein
MDGLDNHVQATADSGLSPVEAAIVAPEDAPLPTEPSELDHVKEYEHDFEDEAEVPVEGRSSLQMMLRSVTST